MIIKTFCCGRSMEISEAVIAENVWGEFWVCSEDHGRLVEMATLLQMNRLKKEYKDDIHQYAHRDILWANPYG